MEFSVFGMLIILAIVVLNFAIISYFKNKIALVSAVMISNLMIILLYSTIISDQKSLQELILATILYSITVLILISNVNQLNQLNSSDKSCRAYVSKTSENQRFLGYQCFTKNTNYVLLFVIALTLSFGSVYLVNNIQNQPKTINNHNAQNLELENNEFQPRNKKNILLQRSADAILIMVGTITMLLLSSKYRNRESRI